MRHVWISALSFALIASAAMAAEDVETAVVATVKSVDKGAKTASVKTADGTERTFHFVKRTVGHGTHAAVKGTEKGSKDAFEDVKEGDQVVVHYTKKGAEETAEEVDHVGKDGLKASVVAIKSINRGAKTVAVKTESGAEETYQLTDRALKESGKGLEKAGKVTVYYTEESGKKVAHFFKGN